MEFGDFRAYPKLNTDKPYNKHSLSTTTTHRNRMLIKPRSPATKPMNNSNSLKPIESTSFSSKSKQFGIGIREHIVKLTSNYYEDWHKLTPIMPYPTMLTQREGLLIDPARKSSLLRKNNKLCSLTKEESKLLEFPFGKYSNCYIPFAAEGAPTNATIEYLCQFAQAFKLRRIRLGFSQLDVTVWMAEFYDFEYTQTTLSRFESLNLTSNNMLKLRPYVEEWLLDFERRYNESLEIWNNLKEGDVDTSAIKLAYEYRGIGRELINRRGHGGIIFRPRQIRTQLTDKQKGILEHSYLSDPMPNSYAIYNIAHMLNIEQSVVKNWFNNRRQKARQRNVNIDQLANKDEVNNHQIEALMEKEINNPDYDFMDMEMEGECVDEDPLEIIDLVDADLDGEPTQSNTQFDEIDPQFELVEPPEAIEILCKKPHRSSFEQAGNSQTFTIQVADKKKDENVHTITNATEQNLISNVQLERTSDTQCERPTKLPKSQSFRVVYKPKMPMKKCKRVLVPKDFVLCGQAKKVLLPSTSSSNNEKILVKKKDHNDCVRLPLPNYIKPNNSQRFICRLSDGSMATNCIQTDYGENMAQSFDGTGLQLKNDKIISVMPKEASSIEEVDDDLSLAHLPRLEPQV